ncbi:MAG: segregation/condensation protein A [Gemmatimonadetes bacterium]|nr:segregation/condensation protein A [Gemmatimonadota bacterium]MDE3258519.1 segregation/condensation protein A [Gemmatimonadota bacterium]
MNAEAPAVQGNAGGDIYGVKLDVFEGPLDLLLFLIRRDEIDIYDIPIADVTRQFLEFVEMMQTLNLEPAGDFLVMAATLMKIKSRMLLPADPDADEDEEDPREALVRRLLEYQQFKEVANWLEDKQDSHRDSFYRGAALDAGAIDEPEQDPLAVYGSVSLFDLMAAFQTALMAAPKADYHEIHQLEVTTEERMEVVRSMLEERHRVQFSDLVSGLPRIVLIVTFIALLELIKTGRALARQSGSEGEIWVYRRDEDQTEPGSESAPDR